MSEQQIFKLIPKIMAEVKAIEKGRKNQQQNYTFRGIDDIFAAFHDPLARHGVFYVPEVLSREVTERTTSKGSTLIYTTLTIAYTFYAPDGSSVRAVVVGEAMDSGDKSSNKAMSAALKYALLQIFCVPTEEMEDADSETHEVVGNVSAEVDAALKKLYLGKGKTEAEWTTYYEQHLKTAPLAAKKATLAKAQAAVLDNNKEKKEENAA
jgi:ERF superfamily